MFCQKLHRATGIALAITHANAANITNESHMTLNSEDYGTIAVGKTVPTTSTG